MLKRLWTQLGSLLSRQRTLLISIPSKIEKIDICPIFTLRNRIFFGKDLEIFYRSNISIEDP